MTEFAVIIECSEKFIYETEAYNEHDAIAKAFLNRYAWQHDYEANKVTVTVNERNEGV